jgi:acetyltransferase-like isoleucine patch superfamily enzyme
MTARPAQSHGTGAFAPTDFVHLGEGVVFEAGVLVFHPETIEIGDGVYIGHQTILKGYHRNRMVIGAGTWIGQQCFFHSAGGLTIGQDVGVGPGVKIVTSTHRLDVLDQPILHAPIDLAPVVIEDGGDIGVGAILLPGVTVGRGAQIGAGAVVTSNIPAWAIAAGVPARVIGSRR